MINAERSEFFGTACHEIGHILGIYTMVNFSHINAFSIMEQLVSKFQIYLEIHIIVYLIQIGSH